ncbi:hypothetical protein MJO28_005408 [Puccinia striiformis f. sp. tritici]|uniref:Uncharacterized protein n=1 Tax=Puccinia striiformis f. sp. tritici TaxID=168172 RepID=A0ACC0EK70_9BASI|nr:hypothetical protein MJO28_005408 [Puccinia striiformis f. sp. tritici]
MKKTSQSQKVNNNNNNNQTTTKPTGPDQTYERTEWPDLKHKHKLKVETIISSQIMTISDLLSAAECRSIVQKLDDLKTVEGDNLRFETTSQIPKPGHAFRYNDRISIHDPPLAKHIWNDTGLKKYCQDWINSQSDTSTTTCWGLNPNLRFYRYKKGHKFEKHFDDSVQISSADLNLTDQISIIPSKLVTEYTLLIYLTGSKSSRNDKDEEEVLEGGETVFYDPPIRSSKRVGKPEYPIAASIKPATGLALIHRHGSHCLLHEAREVVSGVKYVLRSDLIFG